MKSDLRTVLVATLTAVTLCAMILCMTACFEPPTAIIDPVDDTPATPTTTRTTRPTVAVPEGQLTITDLMRIHAVEIPWSDLEGFTHDMTGDNTARFTVADGYGQECALDVTIDYDSGYLTQADLSYDGTSESILDESMMPLMTILYAMNGKLPAE